MSTYDKIVHSIGTAAGAVLLATESDALVLPAWVKIILILAMGAAGITSRRLIGGDVVPAKLPPA
jgi:hypothetical protein